MAQMIEILFFIHVVLDSEITFSRFIITHKIVPPIIDSKTTVYSREFGQAMLYVCSTVTKHTYITVCDLISAHSFISTQIPSVWYEPHKIHEFLILSKCDRVMPIS